MGRDVGSPTGRRFSITTHRAQLIGGALLVSLLVGALVPQRDSLAAFLALAALVSASIVISPLIFMLFPFMAAFAYWRVGPDALNMSACDAATLLAVIASFPFVPWRYRAFRRLLIGLCIYLSLLLVPLVAHPTSQAIGEWFHRSILYGGALLIGAAVANRGAARLAIRICLATTTVVAIAAVVDALQHNLAPAFPFGMHKNAVGVFMCVGVITLFSAPATTGLSASNRQALGFLFILGLAASQSRGACLALVAIVAISALRQGRKNRRLPLVLLVASFILIVGSAITLKSETQVDPEFNSIATRIDVYEYAIDHVWLPDPFVGGGLRWFITAPGTLGVPHNLIVGELSEVGLFGLLALTLLVANTLAVLSQRKDEIGDAAFLIFVFTLLASLSGIFWVAGSLTLPMLFVGLAVGTYIPSTPME